MLSLKMQGIRSHSEMQEIIHLHRILYMRSQAWKRTKQRSHFTFLHLGNVSSVHLMTWERKLLSAAKGHCCLLQTVSISLLRDGDRHFLGGRGWWCRRCEKCVSPQAPLECRQQLRTIAMLKKEKQTSSPNYIYKAENTSAYPADSASIKWCLPCTYSSRSSTTNCIIRSHTDWGFWDTSTEQQEISPGILTIILHAAHTWHPRSESTCTSAALGSFFMFTWQLTFRS